MGKNTRKSDKAAGKGETGRSHAQRVSDMSNITLVASIMLIYFAAITVVLVHL